MYDVPRPEQNQLVTKLSQILGNKPNLTVSVAGIKPLSDAKSQVVITVQEKGATGLFRLVNSGQKLNEFTEIITGQIIPQAQFTKYLQQN